MSVPVGDDPHYSTGEVVPEFIDATTRQASRGAHPATGAKTTEPAEPLPVLVSRAPITGPAAGGTAVTLTGTNFGGSTGVTVGGTAATSVVVVNNQTITCVSPAKVAAAYPIVVLNPAGNSVAVINFTYT